jgi:hypothetical protein
MTHVIDFHQAKSQRQREAVVRSFYDMFNYAVDFFIHYWFYPLVAAVETVRRRKLVVL